MRYTTVPEDVMKQLDTFRVTGTGKACDAQIFGVVTECMHVFGTARAKSARPFDASVVALIASAGVREMMVLADPDDYVLYGLAMPAPKDVAGHIMLRVNESGGGFCMEGVEVEGWQVYEA